MSADPELLSYVTGVDIPANPGEYDELPKFRSYLDDVDRQIKRTKETVAGGGDETEVLDSVNDIESEYDYVLSAAQELTDCYENLIEYIYNLETAVGNLANEVQNRLTPKEKEDWDKHVVWKTISDK